MTKKSKNMDTSDEFDAPMDDDFSESDPHAEEDTEILDEATGKPTNHDKPGWRSGRQTPLKEWM